MNKTPLTSVEQLTKCNECNGSGRNKCPVTECPHSSHRCIGCDERGYDHIEPNDIEEDRNQAYTRLVEGIKAQVKDINGEGSVFDDFATDIIENVVKPLYNKTGDN